MLATKADLREIEVALRTDLQKSEASLRADLREVETSPRADLRENDNRLKVDLRETEGRPKADIADLSHRVDLGSASARADMKLLEQRMTVELGTLVAAGIPITPAHAPRRQSRRSARSRRR
ncbi:MULTISPECIES: hypothetical protein [Methylobacterium]|uniref:hypothetical protein n=1 Tax=Methylobacterium TaxID=407 RepID=UPI0013EAC3E3|nr:hypothetical protein [Methylobacterium sp. DB0501]NGM35297.1 hypothetical protein [Methylobacterium sp. DB0501]